MRIYHEVTLKGTNYELPCKAVIDTGSEISLIPTSIANQIGVFETLDVTKVIGVHNDSKECKIVIANILFPSLENAGGNFRFALTPYSTDLIIGMDILTPLGISIDTRKKFLQKKNEIWEAFKTLAGIGVIVYGCKKVFDYLAEEEKDSK
jgi:predicted aspartyl protease